MSLGSAGSALGMFLTSLLTFWVALRRAGPFSAPLLSHLSRRLDYIISQAPFQFLHLMGT